MWRGTGEHDRPGTQEVKASRSPFNASPQSSNHPEMSAYRLEAPAKTRKISEGSGNFVDTSCSEMNSKAFPYTLIHGSHGSLKTG